MTIVEYLTVEMECRVCKLTIEKCRMTIDDFGLNKLKIVYQKKHEK